MYRTLIEMLDARAAESPDAVAQYGKDAKGLFYPIPYSLLQKRARAMALALEGLGIARGDKVGIISDNRPEWLVADLAVLMLGAADVPRGRDAMPYEVEHILKTTEARVAFAENRDQLDKVLCLHQSLPALETVILIEGEVPEVQGIDVIGYGNLLEKGLALLDSSSASLEFSRHRLGRYGERASFVCGSAEALPFPPSSFSAAVMSDALYYVDMEKAFAEAWRILVPGGFFVVAVEATDSGGAPSYLSGIAVIRGAEDIMKALCRQGFRIVRSDAGRTAWACIVAQKPMC